MTGQPTRPRPNHAWPGVEIKAAGAVLYRPAGEGIEVALIHRPRRSDWTFPKGKLEPAGGTPRAGTDLHQGDFPDGRKPE